MAVQDVEVDRQQGREAARIIEKQIGLVETPNTAPYVKSIGQRLVRALPDKKFDYTFAIVDMPEPNAFATPGGFVYVSRGLLPLINSEDELANIIGHEIIHARKRHAAQKLAKQRLGSILTLPGRAVGRVIDRDIGQILNSPMEGLSTAVIAGYSRGNESEADKLGQKLSAAAGYDPMSLAPILNRLEQEAQLRAGIIRPKSFFDTHPATPQRVEETTAHARTIRWTRRPALAGNRTEFFNHLKGLLIGKNPAAGVFHGQKFLHSDLDFFIEFPEGWVTLNTPEVVAAVAPKQDGLLFLGLQGKGSDAKQMAMKISQAMNNEFGIKPSQSKPFKVGNMDGYLITFTDNTGKEPVHMHHLWVANRGLMYQMIGLAPEYHRESLKKAALSFGPLTPEQRASVKETRLRIASAKSGESLAQLSKRTENEWDLQTTAIMNGIEVDHSLSQGELIKIAVSIKYKGK